MVERVEREREGLRVLREVYRERLREEVEREREREREAERERETSVAGQSERERERERERDKGVLGLRVEDVALIFPDTLDDLYSLSLSLSQGWSDQLKVARSLDDLSFGRHRLSLSLSLSLSPFTSYTLSLPTSLSTLSTSLSLSPSLSALCSQLKSESKRGDDLASLLVTPVQRLPRLELLLTTLLPLSPSLSPDSPALSLSLSLLQRRNAHTNYSAKRHSESSAVDLFRRKTRGIPPGWEREGRRLLCSLALLSAKSGDVRPRLCLFFLFDDTLVRVRRERVGGGGDFEMTFHWGPH
jgi:hypothetical protein